MKFNLFCQSSNTLQGTLKFGLRKEFSNLTNIIQCNDSILWIIHYI